MKHRCIGFDVGGANIKCADTDGLARQVEFPLWRSPHVLANVLSDMVRNLPDSRYDGWGLTMTGELADCFATKGEGVTHIVTAMESACSACGPLWVYGLPGTWLDADEAKDCTDSVAAANWHALANLLCQDLPSPRALLVDMGSTTTDLIPLARGGPTSRGQTDTQRLQSGELLYTGVQRTPVCAVRSSVPYRGAPCPVAAEVFATTGDAYVMLGRIPEDPLRCDTADGRPRTRACSQSRLARMVCADTEEFRFEDAVAVAEAVMEAQVRAVSAAIDTIVQRERLHGMTLLLSGEGEFLLREAVQPWDDAMQIVSYRDRRGEALSRTAPALAVATLLQQQLGSIGPRCDQVSAAATRPNQP